MFAIGSEVVGAISFSISIINIGHSIRSFFELLLQCIVSRTIDVKISRSVGLVVMIMEDKWLALPCLTSGPTSGQVPAEKIEALNRICYRRDWG